MKRLVLIAISFAIVLTGCDVEATPTESPDTTRRATFVSDHAATMSANAMGTIEVRLGRRPEGTHIAPPTSLPPQATPTRLSPTSTATEATSTVVATARPSPAATATETPEPTPTVTIPPEPPADPLASMPLVPVTRVIDGDTIEVNHNGQITSVRLIGVNTPETVHPQQPVQCFGTEASAFTTMMIERAGWQVYLEKDVSETDMYNRLLRYVWLPHDDGMRMLNQELVSQGYAQVLTYPPDVRYSDLFRELQATARNQDTGLWGACGAFGVPLATPIPLPTATPIPQPVATPTPVPVVPVQPVMPSGCDPSYPDVCIPPYPPDLNCGDIPFRRFRVTGSDPHGFDRDQDGIGCESG